MFSGVALSCFTLSGMAVFSGLPRLAHGLLATGRRGGAREIIYLSLHCNHQNDSCIKMDSHINQRLVQPVGKPVLA